MRHSRWLALGFVGLVGCGAAPGEQPGATEDTSVAEESSELTFQVSAAVLASPVLAVQPGLIAAAAKDQCAALNDYTAALASRVIDCVGTIGPDQFVMDANKRLRRSEKFARCTLGDATALSDIDSLLSLQQRREGAPLAPTCIAGRWSTWHDTFVKSGITSCPLWKKSGVINPVTPENTKRITQTLPQLPAKGGRTAPTVPHENYIFKVGYPNSPVPERCGTAGKCAQACAAGFAGFVQSVDGDTVIGDPVYWLITKVYAGTNPFNAPYYHAMSYSGDLPGQLYGHYNRVSEACSRYMASDGTHHPSKLIADCLIPGDPSTCLARCQNPLDPGQL
jgi:hypothetical protein